ncbi:hypothetical protein BY458DRAFT_520096 [Sporodiniella umbellata]|nr:hypothetical protein BY458DRAFT_520096 [Sporodiniella umbellata]
MADDGSVSGCSFDKGRAVKKTKIMSLSKTRQGSFDRKGGIEAQPASQAVMMDYACPVCSEDLSGVSSSESRQRHVEGCLDRDNQQEEECMLCGKCLRSLNLDTRRVHLNRCLDQQTGLSSLDDGPIYPTALEKQKPANLKPCQKQHGVSIEPKQRWLSCGHVLKPCSTTSPETMPKARPATSHHDVSREDDTDFCPQVTISRMNRSLQPKQVMDEALQISLALSKSMVSHEASRRRALKRVTQRDYNSANVWSIEESRQKAIEKLETILFPQEENQDRPWPRTLGPTRFSTSPKLFWNLAGNKDLNWDHYRFTSLFLQPLERK